VKRLLVIGFVLALVLMLVIPSVTLAAPKPSTFSAHGTLTSIDNGTVKQLGNSGKWLVTDRHLTGQFQTGNLSGSFVLTYGGVFDLQTQAGNLVGVLKNGSSSFGVEGKTNPLTYVGILTSNPVILSDNGILLSNSTFYTGINLVYGAFAPTGALLYSPGKILTPGSTLPAYTVLPKGTTLPAGTATAVAELTASGHWAGIDRISATGDFTATINFLPTPDGHISTIVDGSNFDMTGKYINSRDQK